MTPKLEYAFTLRAYVSKEDFVDLGPVKSGAHRMIAPVTHGFIEGPGMNAKLLPGGSDWLLVSTISAQLPHSSVVTLPILKDCFH